MRETSKASIRRFIEHQTKVFPWMDLFKGDVLDVGSGDDPLQCCECKTFDIDDGDANQLSRYFLPESFDCIHASNLVEHLHDPIASFKDWATLLKPNAVIVAHWPDFDAYEKRKPVSAFNMDHKSFFSMWRKGYPGVKLRFIHVPTMLKELEVFGLTTLRAELVTRNYDWNESDEVDQTFDALALRECFIEVVLQKKVVDKKETEE